MRIKFVALSGLMGCLALFLGLTVGHTQNPDAAPVDRARGVRPQLPSSPAPEPVAPSGWADERFRRLDRDADGHLSFDEMTDNLKAEKDKWDVHGDGRIDLVEWRTYVEAFIAQQRRSAPEPGNRVRNGGRDQRRQDPGQEPRVSNMARPPFNEERLTRPAVRPPFNERRLSRSMAERNKKGVNSGAAKWPSNLPAWFKDYDANGDGQIALHEWKDKQDKVPDFLKYDLNKDGFITVEELIRSGQFVTSTNEMPPPMVNGLRAEVGEFFYFEVTGAIRGFVWGTDIYTTDSPIATAAVHAGVLRVGETALVKVAIMPGQESYVGSDRAGVRTQHFGAFPLSYRVEAAPFAPRPAAD